MQNTELNKALTELSEIQKEVYAQRERDVLYDVFGYGPEAYGLGMDCGYVNGDDYQRMRSINRLEVIGDGCEFVKHLKDDERVRYELQDDDRTLKVFIDKVTKVDV